jgi:hypothetical protein
MNVWAMVGRALTIPAHLPIKETASRTSIIGPESRCLFPRIRYVNGLAHHVCTAGRRWLIRLSAGATGWPQDCDPAQPPLDSCSNPFIRNPRLPTRGRVCQEPQHYHSPRPDLHAMHLALRHDRHMSDLANRAKRAEVA